MRVDQSNPFIKGFLAAFKVPTRLTVTEWADQFRILPSKGSAEPGRYRSTRTPYMIEPMDALSVSSGYQEIMLMAAAQTGKALALDTPIPTPSGWSTMGSLSVGDAVFDQDGQQCRVIAKSQVFTDHDCYELEFSDGTKIVADANHRWETLSGHNRQRAVVTTETIASRIRLRGGNRYKHAIRFDGAVELSKYDQYAEAINTKRYGHTMAYIVSARRVPTVPVQCISVDSPRHLFLAGEGMIPTHNSETGNNWVGYVIQNAPGPMLLVQPTVENAKRYSNQRISPMILATPELSGLVNDNKSRDTTNTMLSKDFPGGILMMGGANSAAGLRSMPIKYLFADEISNWPADVDGEGDPLGLAEERTNTFGRKRKIFKCSTPGIKGVCRIESEYEKTDQRKYHVPCPQCGHMHVLAWANFIIPKNDAGQHVPRKAHMACPSCGGVIEEHHKTDMLNAGVWVASCPEKADPERVGYHISALYSPIGWKSWAKVARQWLDAQGDPTKLKAFINNVLAETWHEGGQTISEHALMERAEEYSTNPLPEGVFLITAGVDVQPDRLEVELVGWGLGEESWSLDYKVIRGDPNANLVWQQLDMHLTQKFMHPCGIAISPVNSFIDTGGANTKAVYDYVRDRSHMGIYGIKGIGGDGKAAVGTPQKNNIGKIPLVPLGTFTLKDTVHGRLKIETPGAGYCHFPKKYGAEYYQQMTSEEVRTRYNKGFAVREWHKKTDSTRNEVFDCRVYATAAMLQGGWNFQQLAEMFAQAMSRTDQQSNGRSVRGGFETD